jgi:hypothetical protein
MASPQRFRPALVSLASVLVLIGYGLVQRPARETIPFYRLEWALVLALVGAAMAAPLVFVARIGARARLRATGRDAFARIRRWAAAWPRAASALLATPTLAMLAASYSHAFLYALTWESDPAQLGPHPRTQDAVFFILLVWIAPSLGSGLVWRSLLRGFLVPLADDAAVRDAEGFTFSAVAVTPETRAAVFGIIALTVGVVAALGWVPSSLLYKPLGAALILGYAAAATGAVWLFQRASRIGVGFDGVLVHGSSRTRFYAYRDIDEVEATRWGDVLLRRQGRVVLRLQLHGTDEGRHVAVAERIRAGLSGAREQAGGAAHRLVEARGKASFVHAATGQASFRSPGMTRDALWEVVEAAASSGESRVAAAEALEIGASPEDRARLRFAAERCAEPAVRSALAWIGNDFEDCEEETDEALEALRAAARPAKSA